MRRTHPCGEKNNLLRSQFLSHQGTLTVLVLLSLLLPTPFLHAAVLSFSDFSSVTGLALNGSAAQVGNVLQLTPVAGGVGSAWTSSRVDVAGGFDTTFTYNIFGGSGADGLTFTIQNSGVTALGASGGGIGSEGITDAVSVAFRTWVFNVIEIQSCGPGLPQSSGCALATISTSPRGQHTVRVLYVPGTLSVFFDGSQVLSTSLNLPSAMNLTNGQAFVGFTAATGAATDDQRITSWQFSSGAGGSSACAPSAPAPLSGSTGLLGVMDSANWPGGADQALIAMDTGQVTYRMGTTVVSSGTLPGAGPSGFPNGVLHFDSVRLGPQASLLFTTGINGLPPPVILLSCRDVTLEAGSTLSVNPLAGAGPVPGAFQGAAGATSESVTAGFGPRTGTLPRAASLYPAVGGGGGDGSPGSPSSPGPGGGGGGAALVISAAQRITVNGIIGAIGLSASQAETVGAQGGAGGSVRLSALLVEGSGSILTSAGADSDGSVRGPSGPVEIQAFLQDAFTGTTVTTPIWGNAPVQPLPANLPVISLDQVNSSSPVFEQFGFSNTGSLTAADVTLPVPSIAQVEVLLSVSTQNVPEGTILAVRAVGLDGSADSTFSVVSSAEATAALTLNAGTTYQIVATPNTSFALLRDPASVTVTARSLYPPILPMAHGAAAVSQWRRAFGASAELAASASGSRPLAAFSSQWAMPLLAKPPLP